MLDLGIPDVLKVSGAASFPVDLESSRGYGCLSLEGEIFKYPVLQQLLTMAIVSLSCPDFIVLLPLSILLFPLRSLTWPLFFALDRSN